MRVGFESASFQGFETYFDANYTYYTTQTDHF